jgi:type VI secretion system protein VasD
VKFIGESGSTRLLRWVFGACVAVALAACASAPKPTQLTGGSIEGSAQLNPSVNKRPSPLVLRVYELKNATAFNSADFVALYERDKAELAPEVKFIGVMGAFRDLERAQWRSVVAVLPGQKQRVTIRADGLALSVTVAK